MNALRAVDYLTAAVSIIGIVIILWGVVVSLREFLSFERRRDATPDPYRQLNLARKHLSAYLLLGLEFLVAADIIRTITNPSLQDVAILGSIVAIRTVLSYFLNLESRETAGQG